MLSLLCSVAGVDHRPESPCLREVDSSSARLLRGESISLRNGVRVLYWAKFYTSFSKINLLLISSHKNIYGHHPTALAWQVSASSILYSWAIVWSVISQSVSQLSTHPSAYNNLISSMWCAGTSTYTPAISALSARVPKCQKLKM